MNLSKGYRQTNKTDIRKEGEAYSQGSIKVLA